MNEPQKLTIVPPKDTLIKIMTLLWSGALKRAVLSSVGDMYIELYRTQHQILVIIRVSMFSPRLKYPYKDTNPDTTIFRGQVADANELHKLLELLTRPEQLEEVNEQSIDQPVIPD